MGSNTRVYALAKELGLSSKELLSQLQSKGIEATSHMSLLSDEQIRAYKETSTSEQPAIQQTKTISQAISKNQSLSTKEPKITEPSKSVISPKHVDAVTAVNQETKPVEAPVEQTKPVVVAQQSFGQARFSGRSSREPVQRVVTEIFLSTPLPLYQAAALMGKQPKDLILVLLKQGSACTQNHVLSVETITALAQDFGITVVRQQVKKALDRDKSMRLTDQDGQLRAPVVVVMGHVDHGKTTFLDYIRRKNTAAREAGGITQHIAAYKVTSTHGNIVFLDTPGHEAFSFVRQQGTRVTDLVVLMVDVNSGVQPQTVEAIKYAQEGGVPIVVAINKIDAMRDPSGQETIKRQLVQHGVTTEDWGGDTVCVAISAKTGQGIDELLELLVLQSQIMDLRARHDVPAKAFVLESSLRQGYGPVLTVICVEGLLSRGDYFVCGNGVGKVKLLLDENGGRVEQVGPSDPVMVVGIEDLSSAGEWLKVIPEDEFVRCRRSGVQQNTTTSHASNVHLMQKGGLYDLALVLKVDTRGTKEALSGELEKIIKAESVRERGCNVRIAHISIGNVIEHDVELAKSAGATILALQVRTEKNAKILAKSLTIAIQEYNIIYKLLDDVKAMLNARRQSHISWDKVGQAVVRKVFDIKGVGVIAGCLMQDGVIAKGDKTVCIRGGKQMGEGLVTSLQQEKRSAKEVRAGFECGFTNDHFQEWKEEDIVHIFRKKEHRDE